MASSEKTIDIKKFFADYKALGRLGSGELITMARQERELIALREARLKKQERVGLVERAIGFFESPKFRWGTAGVTATMALFGQAYYASSVEAACAQEYNVSYFNNNGGQEYVYEPGIDEPLGRIAGANVSLKTGAKEFFGKTNANGSVTIPLTGVDCSKDFFAEGSATDPKGLPSAIEDHLRIAGEGSPVGWNFWIQKNIRAQVVSTPIPVIPTATAEQVPLPATAIPRPIVLQQIVTPTPGITSSSAHWCDQFYGFERVLCNLENPGLYKAPTSLRTPGPEQIVVTSTPTAVEFKPTLDQLRFDAGQNAMDLANKGIYTEKNAEDSVALAITQLTQAKTAKEKEVAESNLIYQNALLVELKSRQLVTTPTGTPTIVPTGTPTLARPTETPTATALIPTVTPSATSTSTPAPTPYVIGTRAAANVAIKEANATMTAVAVAPTQTVIRATDLELAARELELAKAQATAEAAAQALTPTRVPSATTTLTATATMSPTASRTPTATATGTPIPTKTATATATQTEIPTATPKPTEIGAEIFPTQTSEAIYAHATAVKADLERGISASKNGTPVASLLTPNATAKPSGSGSGAPTGGSSGPDWEGIRKNLDTAGNRIHSVPVFKELGDIFDLSWHFGGNEDNGLWQFIKYTVGIGMILPINIGPIRRGYSWKMLGGMYRGLRILFGGGGHPPTGRVPAPAAPAGPPHGP